MFIYVHIMMWAEHSFKCFHVWHIFLGKNVGKTWEGFLLVYNWEE